MFLKPFLCLDFGSLPNIYHEPKDISIKRVLEAHLFHIFTVGANLGAAQVLTQHGASEGDVSGVLRIASDSASGELIFAKSEVHFKIIFDNLKDFGVEAHTRDAIEAGIFHFQGQLREFY